MTTRERLQEIERELREIADEQPLAIAFGATSGIIAAADEISAALHYAVSPEEIQALKAARTQTA